MAALYGVVVTMIAVLQGISNAAVMVITALQRIGDMAVAVNSATWKSLETVHQSPEADACPMGHTAPPPFDRREWGSWGHSGGHTQCPGTWKGVPAHLTVAGDTVCHMGPTVYGGGFAGGHEGEQPEWHGRHGLCGAQ